MNSDIYQQGVSHKRKKDNNKTIEQTEVNEKTIGRYRRITIKQSERKEIDDRLIREYSYTVNIEIENRRNESWIQLEFNGRNYPNSGYSSLSLEMSVLREGNKICGYINRFERNSQDESFSVREIYLNNIDSREFYKLLYRVTRNPENLDDILNDIIEKVEKVLRNLKR